MVRVAAGAARTLPTRAIRANPDRADFSPAGCCRRKVITTHGCSSTPPERFGYACLAVLRAAKAGEEPCQRVDAWLEEALRKDPNALGVVVCQADLRDLVRRYPESETLYRRVLQRDPRNLVALNNLAWQLALREGSAADALSLAEQALDVGGPQAALLDTRALALLANQKTAAALSDLDDAARSMNWYFNDTYELWQMDGQAMVEDGTLTDSGRIEMLRRLYAEHRKRGFQSSQDLVDAEQIILKAILDDTALIAAINALEKP